MGKRERLAKAWATAWELDWDSLPDGPKWGYHYHRGQFLDGVDALLAELREPDEEMVEAVARAIDPTAFAEVDDNPTFRQKQPNYRYKASQQARAAITAFMDKAGEE